MIVNKKKILVFTNLFPPDGGSGVHRIVKFVKYLEPLGFRSYVITGNNNGRQDMTLLDDIPQKTKIFRKQAFHFKIGNTLIKIIKLLKTWLFLPDGYILKVLARLFLAKKIMNQYSINTIFASSPPYSIIVGAVILKKMTGAKLILDFRDPWADNPFHHWTPLKRFFQYQIESWAVKQADVLIANTMELYGVLIKKYPDKKIITINNGFDQSDFLNINVDSNDKKELPLSIVHTGEFYSEIRSPDSLLTAIGELLKEGKVNESSLSIKFFGGGELTEEETFLDLMNRYDLDKVIENNNFIPHKEAIVEMMKADVLLLMQNSAKLYMQIPAKAFEYLYLRKTVLCLAPHGATSDLIHKTDSGFVVDPENISELKEKIIQLVRLKKEGKLEKQFSFKDIDKYDRKNLTLKLSTILDTL